jgi:hypothetical protein
MMISACATLVIAFNTDGLPDIVVRGVEEAQR